MVRGTIATICKYNDGSFHLFKSSEFNGNMGPDMENGIRLRLLFQEKFFNPANAPLKTLEDIVVEMLLTFGYVEKEELENGDIPSNRIFKKVDLDLVGSVLDLHSKKTSDGRLDYNADPWWKYFNGSDWTYIVNLSGETLHIQEGEGQNRLVEFPTGTILFIRYGRTIEYAYNRFGLEKK